ncbi:MAG: tetratricopeptide repeat protein [Deltaproteobacteria bacterium]|nr:tetratricopeptide repeat protein [Deltaproteobacteria bacterium]
MVSGPVHTLRYNLSQALKHKNLEEAATALSHLKQIDPLSVETRGMELEFLVKKKDYKSGATLALQLTKLFPDSGRVLLLAGHVYYGLKDYKKAATYFTEASRVNPHRVSEYWRAKALTQMGAFAEAGPILELLVRQYPPARMDLGWLYERQKKWQLALDQYGMFLEAYPDHEFALKKVVEMKARMLDSKDLIEEMEDLAELGDETPPHLIPPLIEKLLKTADVEGAREVIKKNLEPLRSKFGVDAGWTCYRFKAFDLAFELFALNIQTNLDNFKFLNTIEMCARKCNRVAGLKTIYEALAAGHKPLYGRLRRLDKLLT